MTPVPRAEQPLVGAGDEVVAVEVGEADVFHAETMHAVDHVDDPVLFVALLVEFAHQLADLADRQLHAAARLHPGHAQHPGLRADLSGDAGQDLVGGNPVRVLEQRELADLGTHALVPVFQGGVGGVVLVGGGQDLLARLHQQAAVDRRQAVGGAAGERHLARLHGEVATCPGASLVLVFPDFLAMPVHRFARVAVEADPQALDGLPHRPRVGGEEEVGEVQILRVEIELLAQRFPLIAGVARCAFGAERLGSGKQRQAGGENAGLLEKGTTVVHREVRCGVVRGWLSAWRVFALRPRRAGSCLPRAWRCRHRNNRG